MASANVLLAAISTLININRRSFAYLPIYTCIVLDTGSISLSVALSLTHCTHKKNLITSNKCEKKMVNLF